MYKSYEFYVLKICIVGALLMFVQGGGGGKGYGIGDRTHWHGMNVWMWDTVFNGS